ncbi:MAG TPA: hypothetical protein PKL81_11020 [Ferruginibacter sp.]|mgnify:FL=1|nr:hypothetical protein [Chitinophagales bacterium]HMU71372.1 hypothetical protein [Ferruginibacter sp.]HMX80639.1 hypothetical protein [Ferruginibacter sp.]HNA02075.1 hypothetical protein [Ferruginibacter sp.]HNK29305.1 hypothetical protein [Ferruginibacter sp.]
MKKFSSLLALLFISGSLLAQHSGADSMPAKVTVTKDPRLDILAKAEAEINSYANRFTKGYRLFVLKTTDRNYAMRVRTYLLQNFPEEKVVMTFQAPFIKMKFGDFVDKKEAEKCRDIILKSGVVTGGVYLLPEMVELKPDKLKELESK